MAAVGYSSTESIQLTETLLKTEYQPPYRILRTIPPVRINPLGNPSRRITAHSAVVLDAKSGATLWEHHGSEILPIASLTKLVTAIVFLEQNIPLDTEVTIADEDTTDVEGSTLKVKTGEVVTVRDLLYSSLVGSANNATKALARSTGLTAEQFIARMNAVVQRLGLQSTSFSDVTGLDPRNVSTVTEYARIARYAFQNNLITSILSTDEYSFETVDKHISHRIRNTNVLLGDADLGLVGAKTGYLDEAGYTFACEAMKGGNNVIVVLFRSASSDERFAEAKELIGWAFQSYRWL
ncbi:MAG: serine hydrolase [Patescibacteria group bacterium]|nr:serine hydrolase [Patescibacteria group bacterium]MDD5715333.1 serine hydrolase [Patescibacteria group bacterium]